MMKKGMQEMLMMLTPENMRPMMISKKAGLPMVVMWAMPNRPRQMAMGMPMQSRTANTIMAMIMPVQPPSRGRRSRRLSAP